DRSSESLPVCSLIVGEYHGDGLGQLHAPRMLARGRANFIVCRGYSGAEPDPTPGGRPIGGEPALKLRPPEPKLCAMRTELLRSEYRRLPPHTPRAEGALGARAGQ